MRIIGIIPARYGSTRLPGKPLALLSGRPMIEHVWRQAAKAKCLTRLLVATDDQRIFDAVLRFGGEAVMTPPACASGTDRLAWAAKKIPCDLVVNIQGDEPFLPRTYIDRLVAPLLADKKISMSTLAAPLPEAEARHPGAVKVVCDQKGFALYFSRAPIPFIREPKTKTTGASALLHLGLYAYQRRFLLRFAQWAPTPLEQMEKLEQLRALENQVPIKVVLVAKPTLAIDTPSDLARAQRLLRGKE